MQDIFIETHTGDAWCVRTSNGEIAPHIDVEKSRSGGLERISYLILGTTLRWEKRDDGSKIDDNDTDSEDRDNTCLRCPWGKRSGFM